MMMVDDDDDDDDDDEDDDDDDIPYQWSCPEPRSYVDCVPK